MNLLPSPEQAELVEAARGFLAAELPVAGADEPAAIVATAGALWPKMAELGWFQMAVPAASGGLGGSAVDCALLFREVGRFVASGPLAGSVFGAACAAAGGAGELASSLMAGEVTAGLGEPWRDPAAEVGDSVRGRFRIVDAAGASGHVLLVTSEATALADLSEAAVRPLAAADPTVGVLEATFTGVRPIVAVPAGNWPLGLVARTSAAAMLVGMTEACRDMSVAYAGVREQFGKPIGSFQAVKHRCADLAVRAEAAGALTWLAALSLDEGQPEASSLVASAKALASEYAVTSAHDNVQNHGGMGFTAECPAHRYVKRALEWSVTLGAPDQLLAEVAR